jgi:hypothetical protein
MLFNANHSISNNNLKGFNQILKERPPTIFNFKKNHNFKIKRHNNLHFKIVQQPKKQWPITNISKYFTIVTCISQNNRNRSKIKPTNKLQFQIASPQLEHKEALHNLCLQNKITKTSNQSSSTTISFKKLP